MTFEQAVEYIHSTQKFGSVLGLDTISALLEKMGNPQDHLKFIHIAGTNGKGSTSSYIQSVLTCAGFQVGLYISPYVDNFSERIQMNGEYIKPDALGEITAYVKECIDSMVLNGLHHPTEFEIITAIAFEYFYRQNCDYVVLEVGLGGRFDATNVIKNPLVSVITVIDYDHMEYLGDTLAKIAYEKCGIIKENGHVVSYPFQAEEALAVMKQTCEEKHAKLFVPMADCVDIISQTPFGSEFIYQNMKLTLRMAGIHQVYNAVTAIAALEVLMECHLLPISRENIITGIANVRFPARMEVLCENPLVIVDGAHNYSGIQALCNSLSTILEEKKIILVMGMLRDKEYTKSVLKLSPLCKCFIATTPPNPRAADAHVLAEIAAPIAPDVQVVESPYDAIAYAVRHAEPGEVICVCGSLYMVAEIRRFFQENMDN